MLGYYWHFQGSSYYPSRRSLSRWESRWRLIQKETVLTPSTWRRLLSTITIIYHIPSLPAFLIGSCPVTCLLVYRDMSVAPTSKDPRNVPPIVYLEPTDNRQQTGGKESSQCCAECLKTNDHRARYLRRWRMITERGIYNLRRCTNWPTTH